MQIQKTVFISYRRTNNGLALAILQYLTHHGYDCFLDYESMTAGDFEQIIPNQIASRAHFIVLLTPSALDRCNEPGDWFRREIELAIKLRRNIIPLTFDNFAFENVHQNLTGDLALLERYQALEVPASYFPSAMEKLKSHYLSVPLDMVLHPAPQSDSSKVAQIQSLIAKQPTITQDQLTSEKWFEQGFKRPIDDVKGKIHDYTKAIQLKPDYADAYYNRGVTRNRMGDNSGAISDFDRAIKLRPLFVEAFIQRGIARYLTGELTKALTDYNRAIKLDPVTFPEAYANRGNLRMQKEEYRKAIQDYNKAIDLRPDFVEIYVSRSRCFAYL